MEITRLKSHCLKRRELVLTGECLLLSALLWWRREDERVNEERRGEDRFVHALLWQQDCKKQNSIYWHGLIMLVCVVDFDFKVFFQGH